jgi:hypothetical protein
MIKINLLAALFLLAWGNKGICQIWYKEQMEVCMAHQLNKILHADALFEDRWVVLPQVQFWKRIMTMSPDSSIINVARNRTILEVVSTAQWQQKSEVEKAAYKKELKSRFALDSAETLYVTTGKNDFYRLREVYPSLGKGIEVFENNEVDPWYAQAILLIESPAQLKKSVSGAYGAFQLMPGVAKQYGLTVTTRQDDRADFSKSAFAASQLMKLSCIPSARRILQQACIPFLEHEMGFRLFVMHVYHAGAGNVAAVVAKIKNKENTMELIKTMWITSAASFGNNSQNYSQLALAAQWLLYDYVYSSCDELHSCVGK